MHEWKYNLSDRPQIVANELGELFLDKEEPTENLITWIFDEGSFVPSAKITKDDTFSIVSDYIGKPIAAYNRVGNLVWDVEYDIYGNIRSQSKGNKDFIPFRNQGQYEDSELNGLMYNRFRYYDGNSGTYISQDPTKLNGGNKFYSYVRDSNNLLDPLGLSDFLFRADDNYRGGDIGMPLGTDEADISDFDTHLRKKKTGDTSIYTSFAETKNGTSKFGDNISKVSLEDLKELESQGKIKIHSAENVRDSLGGKKGRNAYNIMKKNDEVLIEGLVPSDIVKRCK